MAQGETEWKTREQLAQRILVLMHQLGDVCSSLQMATTRGVQDDEQRLFRADLEDGLSDLLAQLYTLVQEFGFTIEQHQQLLARGIERMARREQEYKAKGWGWI